MSKRELKDIVPPLELCKMIPEEKFADSVLVWVRNIGLDRTEYAPFVGTRKNALSYNIICPAPTTDEIQEALYQMSEDDVEVTRKSKRVGGGWWVSAWVNNQRVSRQSMNTSATAAMKLWLAGNGVEVRNE